MRIRNTKASLRVQIASAALMVVAQAGLAQSAADIENVVRRSKGIDKSRPVRVIQGDQLLTLSTYSHPQASDQDCKINALFIMKDLLHSFNTIHKMRISYFDSRNPALFRTVEVTEGDVALVDGGKPVASVLSQIALSKGKVNSTSPSTTNAHQRASTDALVKELTSRLSPSYVQGRPSAVRGYTTFDTSDGDVSVAFPAAWKVVENPAYGTLLRCDGPLCYLLMVRDQLNGRSLDEIVRLYEPTIVKGFKNYRKVKERPQNLGSLRGHYQEGECDGSGKIRVFFLEGRTHYYAMSLAAIAHGSDNSIDATFQRILETLRVSG